MDMDTDMDMDVSRHAGIYWRSRPARPASQVAAVGTYEEVFRPTDDARPTHVSNGVRWYFQPGKVNDTTLTYG